MPRILCSIAVAILATVTLSFFAPAVASASTGGSWWEPTKAECLARQRTYESSWTKITKSCAPNGNGWSFSWVLV